MRQIGYFLVFLLSLLSSKVSADEVSKDWVWSVEQDYAYATTTNQQGRIFGQFCYYKTGLCAYIVDLGISCRKSTTFPSLVNTDAGARQYDLVCGKRLHDSNALIIKPFRSIDRLVQHNRHIGLVVALKNGRFRVMNFSLTGAKHAIKMMRSYAKQNAKPPALTPTPKKNPLPSSEQTGKGSYL